MQWATQSIWTRSQPRICGDKGRRNGATQLRVGFLSDGLAEQFALRLVIVATRASRLVSGPHKLVKAYQDVGMKRPRSSAVYLLRHPVEQCVQSRHALVRERHRNPPPVRAIRPAGQPPLCGKFSDFAMRTRCWDMRRHTQRPYMNFPAFLMGKIEVEQDIPGRRRAEVEPQLCADQLSPGDALSAELTPLAGGLRRIHHARR